ncbi:MAG: 4Fe-4S dicluster domain-containing protein [Rhodobacteraceae bacterium]|nr:4Fe-4S dicluster domain-containing protein [Paracoccaceae bacterium]
MTRYSIVADLNRCVGCQTCTAACKHTNATAPGVQWRKVLDIETGEFPDVHRAFMPVGCMHCDDAPCLSVCPTTATRKRDDGIVTIDYDLCIGCAYCTVACPYQARSRVDLPTRAFKGKTMKHEVVREDPKRIGVAQKCTMCSDRIDFGLENGLIPGLDADATPACVNACIAGALHFGDAEDPNSNVSQLLEKNQHFTMHEELGTGPGIHYLWGKSTGNDEPAPEPEMIAEPLGMPGVVPALQKSWDWRAASNFILGGSGTSLFLATAIGGTTGMSMVLPGLLALAMVGLGLFCVWLEIGRPWRFFNVFYHARMSWMTREAMVGIPFMGLGFLTVLTGSIPLGVVAAVFGMAFLYAQGRILRAAKGIPAWRHPGIVPLIVATGLTEGVGIFAVYAVIVGAGSSSLQTLASILLILIALRVFAWSSYRTSLGRIGAPTGTFAAFAADPIKLTPTHQAIPVVLLLVALAVPMLSPVLVALAGALALASGWVFKYGLITRAAFNQGYSLKKMPARGAGLSSPGVKPGWTTN